MESLGTEARGGKGGKRGKKSERRKGGQKGKRSERRKGGEKGRRERKEKRGRKEGDIRDGRRKGASLLKSCTKRVKFSFLLRIMLKMLHFNANRNLFCNFVLRTAVITKFSFPKI